MDGDHLHSSSNCEKTIKAEARNRLTQDVQEKVRKNTSKITEYLPTGAITPAVPEKPLLVGLELQSSSPSKKKTWLF